MNQASKDRPPSLFGTILRVSSDESDWAVLDFDSVARAHDHLFKCDMDTAMVRYWHIIVADVSYCITGDPVLGMAIARAGMRGDFAQLVNKVSNGFNGPVGALFTTSNSPAPEAAHLGGSPRVSPRGPWIPSLEKGCGYIRFNAVMTAGPVGKRNRNDSPVTLIRRAIYRKSDHIGWFALPICKHAFAAIMPRISGQFIMLAAVSLRSIVSLLKSISSANGITRPKLLNHLANITMSQRELCKRCLGI